MDKTVGLMDKSKNFRIAYGIKQTHHTRSKINKKHQDLLSYAELFAAKSVYHDIMADPLDEVYWKTFYIQTIGVSTGYGGYTHSLQKTENLIVPDWIPVQASGPLTSKQTLQFEDDSSASNGFYRVISE